MATRGTWQGEADRAASLEQLLVRSGRGNAEVFAELYDRVAPRVYGVVTSLIQDQAVAERITRDAFVEIWRRAPTYDAGRSSALAWTLAITRRLAVRARRRSQHTANTHDPTVRSDGLSVHGVGLSPVHADAVRLAWLGFDHKEIDAQLEVDTPATALLSDALRSMAPADRRR